MELLIGYFFFATTTALASLVQLFIPVVSKLAKEQPLNPVAQSPLLAYITFLVLAVLVAPIVFFPCIFPEMQIKFKDSLLESLKG